MGTCEHAIEVELLGDCMISLLCLELCAADLNFSLPYKEKTPHVKIDNV